MDLDFEFNFPKPCWRAEFLSVRKRTEQSLFQILVKFPNCFGNSTLGKKLIWIWKFGFWLAGSKISPFSFYFFITTTNQSSSNKTMATTTTTTNDDNIAMITDIYKMVMDELKAASVICPSEEVTGYFNPLLHREVADGTNNRGKL